MKKLLKAVLSAILMFVPLLTTAQAEEVTEVTTETTTEAETQARALPVEGDYVLDPAGVPENTDGYWYVRPGIATNYYGEEVTQVWAGSRGHDGNNEGWSGYVASGTKTLMLTAYGMGMGVGVGTSSVDLETYMPAVFSGGLYSGAIVKMDSSFGNDDNEASLVLLTSTGEIWYTGWNRRNMFSSAADTSRWTTWLKMDVSGLDGTVVDIEMAVDGLFVVTDTGKMYARGWIDNYFSASNIPTGETNWSTGTTLTTFKEVITPDGSDILRIWGISGNAEDETNGVYNDGSTTAYGRSFIIATTSGYFGAAENSNASRVVGITDSSTAGLQKISVVLSDGTKKELEAGSAKQIVMIGNWGITHFILESGQVYTAGYSQWGNVSGTKYISVTSTTAGVVSKGSVRYGNTSGSNASSAELNTWRTWSNFYENESLTDVDYMYDGLLTLAYVNKDGQFMMGSETSAAAGMRAIGYPANGVTYTIRTVTGGWGYNYTQFPIEGIADEYLQFYSTNWNKTERMQRKFFLGLWNGSFAVDQDGMLRVAVRTYSRTYTAYKTLIFPSNIEGESTIRTTEYYPSDTDIQIIDNRSNWDYTNYGTNARISGEYMLLGGVSLAAPIHTYTDGNDTDGDVLTNPSKVSVGPIYDKRYTMDPNRVGEANYDVYTTYTILQYDNETGETGTTVAAAKTAKITDVEAEIDIDALGLDAGFYAVESYRYMTTDTGIEYRTYTETTVFEVTAEPFFEMPGVTEVTAAGYKISTDSGVKAYVRARTDISSNIYITGYSPINDALGAFQTGDVTTNNGTESKNVDFVVGAITEDTAGVYVFTYAVENGGYTTTESEVYVINDGSLVIGSEYILKANDFLIGYSAFGATDAFLIEQAGVKVYDLDGNDVTDSVSIAVDNGGWSQVHGGSYSIKFSVAETDGTPIEKTITGSIDHEPVITFDPIPLAVALSEVTADTYKTGVTVTDEEDGVLTYSTDLDLTTLEAGVYNVTYTATDSHGNKVEKERLVLIMDGDYTEGDNYIIYASDFELRVGEVDTTNAGIIASAGVRVFDKNTGLEETDLESVLTIDKGSYTNAEGEYPDVKVSVTADGTANREITATVITGDAPVLTVPEITTVAVGGTFDILAGVSVSDTEDTLTVDDITYD
ncbi:MAG: hypothetical protein ACK5LZ_00590, partial [Anaerorhabdus sp.]